MGADTEVRPYPTPDPPRPGGALAQAGAGLRIGRVSLQFGTDPPLHTSSG